jgi:hypothetical protein
LVDRSQVTFRGPDLLGWIVGVTKIGQPLRVIDVLSHHRMSSLENFFGRRAHQRTPDCDTDAQGRSIEEDDRGHVGWGDETGQKQGGRPHVTDLGDTIVIGQKEFMFIVIELNQKFLNDKIPGLVQLLIDATPKLPDSMIQTAKQRASQLGQRAVGV